LKKENDTLKQRVQELQSELQAAEKRAQEEEKEAAAEAVEAEQEKRAEARRDDEENLARLKQELAEIEATHAECGHAHEVLENRLAASGKEAMQEQECLRSTMEARQSLEGKMSELANELRDAASKEAVEAERFSEESKACIEAHGVITEQEVAEERLQSSMLAMKAELSEAQKEREVTEEALRLSLAQNPERQQRRAEEELAAESAVAFDSSGTAASRLAGPGPAHAKRGAAGQAQRSPHVGRAAQALLLEIENAYLQTGMLPPPRVL